MASFALTRADVFAVGSTVTVYPRSNFPAVWSGTGEPQGSSTTSAVVASNGTATFTDLADDTKYVAYQASKPYIHFHTEAATPATRVIKTARVTTGSIAGLANAGVTVTWPEAFVDASYTVNADMLEPTAGVSGSLVVDHIESKAAASCVVRVNNRNTGALTGTIHAIAIHD